MGEVRQSRSIKNVFIKFYGGAGLIENYTITEWIAFFFIYSFLGWCIESTIVSVSKRRLTNRGFLKGPMLPLYGSGAVVMLVTTLWAKDNYLLVFCP